MRYTNQNMHTSKIHSTVFLNTSGVVCRIFTLFDHYFFTTCHVAYAMKRNPLPTPPPTPPHTHTLSTKACFCMYNQFSLAMKFCFISLNMLTLKTTAVVNRKSCVNT